MRRTFVPSVATTLIAVASLAQAQVTDSPGAQAAFFAIVLTPAGALPQIVRPQRTIDSGSIAEIALRYGRYKYTVNPDIFSNIGVTGVLNLRRRFQLGATYAHRSCGRCEGLTMGGVELSTSVFHKGASRDVGGDTDVGFVVGAGMGKADSSDISARSLVLSAPLAVSIPQVENSLMTLYLSPSMAYGSLKDSTGTLGGWRPMVGAGLSYHFAFGLGVHASAHKIIIQDSPTHFGLAMSWQFGGKH